MAGSAIDLQIKRATIEQAHLVHEIVQAAFAEYQSKLAAPPGALSDTPADAEHDISEGVVLVAWAGGEPVGTVRYRLEPDYLYIGRLAVLPDRRGKGIGQALMAYVEKLAPGLGRKRIHLGTRKSMPSNIAFYTAIGYRVDGEESHTSGADTVVWLVKEVVPGSSKGGASLETHA
jgi:ribosomal protein S18 acetylase RimI-like enzyme